MSNFNNNSDIHLFVFSLLEVPASQNGYHSSTSPLPPHSPLSPGGPMTGSVSPNPSAHHNSHLNNHLHPSHHQQSQSAVCEYFRASKIHPLIFVSNAILTNVCFFLIAPFRYSSWNSQQKRTSWRITPTKLKSCDSISLFKLCHRPICTYYQQ